MSDIVKAAIRGTQNVDTEVLLPRASYIPSRGEQSVEAQLLLQAGVLGMQRCAGFVASQLDDVALEPICIDSDVVCDEQIIGWLPTLLKPGYRNLLNILISKLHYSGQRLPDEWLPTILNIRDRGIKHLLSERSRWLAALSNKSQWHWATDNGVVHFPMPNPDWGFQLSIWGQLIAFRRLRQTTPTIAREQLIEKWQHLDINYQADFVYSLAYNLSMNDEPFLWDLFTKPVRTSNDANIAYAAAHLMSKLPCSRFVREVAPQMLAGLTFIHKDNGVDIEWNIQALKEVCSWFYPLLYTTHNVLSGEKLEHDFLTLIPLDYWYQLSSLTARELVDIAAHHEVILLAWMKRAVIDADTHMAYAILNCFIGRNHNHQAQFISNYKFDMSWITYHLPYRNTMPEGVQALFNLLTWEQFTYIFELWLQLGEARPR